MQFVQQPDRSALSCGSVNNMSSCGPTTGLLEHLRSLSDPESLHDGLATCPPPFCLSHCTDPY